MKMQACFELGGRKFYVYVPIMKKVPIVDLPPIDEGGPPPPPIPWLESTAIPREVVDDLSVLAGINALAKTLRTPRLQKQFTQSLKEAIPHLDLPKEVSINFDTQQSL
jgi:hypothetical protein